MSGRIFINYRREDEPGFATALYRELQQDFPAEDLIMDTAGHLVPGDDFVEVLNAQVEACDVMLVVIGPRWQELLAAQANKADDFVQIEIGAALEQKKLVVPVLVRGARFPKSDALPEAIRPLAGRHAFGLRPAYFASDSQGLSAFLKERVSMVAGERTGGPEVDLAVPEELRSVPHLLTALRLLRDLKSNAPGMKLSERDSKLALRLLRRAMEESRGSQFQLAPLSSEQRTHQEVNICAFIQNDDPTKAEKVFEALNSLIEALRLVVTDDPPPQSGSWLKRWVTRTTDALSEPEVAERLKKLERAVDLHALHKTQAVVDQNQAAALQAVLGALQGVDDAAIQVGSLLILQTVSNGSGRRVVARTLTQKELAELERDPSLLRNPSEILQLLAVRCP